MVRETRHLWVGNLPDNIREDRIKEHFKRYGRVQNVKLLGRPDTATTGPNGVAVSGVCATVAFMDIKSASKAHNAEHVLDERTLTTEYYEPAAIPSAAGAPSAGSSPAGSGYSGSSSSVNSATVPTPNPASVTRYLSGGEEGSGTCALAATAAAPANWRGTNDSASEYCRRGNTPAAYSRYQRNSSTAPYSTPPTNSERTTPHQRWYGGGATGGESTPSTPGGAGEGSAGAGGARRRLRSGSGSTRTSSSSPEPSDASRASTPAAAPPQQPHHHHAARTPPNNHHQWSSTASGRPLAICVRNLPTRSTDSSLKDGLYHEYKKHGKVVWVKVVGQNADRYAVVRFKKPSDVEKALEVSQDKLFFGCKISVAPHQSCDEDAESAKPYETDIDEYHPKATRTLFIGNLEKDVTQQQLREKFKHFGRIIEIDIKKGSGGGAGYAFCQYASISSVVEAIRAMDGEYVGSSRVKLGFGKPVATTCVWVDGLTEHTEKQVLSCISRCGAATSVCVDRAAGAALVHFEQAGAAGAAVRELRRVAALASAAAPLDPDRPRLAVDYASRECQDAFYEQLEKHGGSAALSGTERLSGELTPRYVPSTRHESLRFDSCSTRSRASSYGRGSSRTPRYPSLELYDPTDYAADRRYRVYDELGSSPQTEEAPFEDRLQSVVVSPHRARRHRRDSSPEDRKHSKERHRSVTGVSVRRSRSGSRGGERHGGRRRHRRRHDGSGSRCSRAGTPLRDEPDAPPCEPRRPPRDRPPLPMSLPLPKFAAQLLRTAPAAPRPAPAPAPDSPPRPPSASSSSAGSAPHSPSLEERIRSLDEKYEKWSGSRALPEAPDRTRLRHRLLEVDINEVKPSEVVRSLLAKRSVFDEDSERLEGAVRAPSPAGSPRRAAPPRALRYPFPAHTPPAPPPPDEERPADPRLNRHERPERPDRPYRLERLGQFADTEYRLETRARPRTPSTDRPQPDGPEAERDPRRDTDRRRSSLYTREDERRLSIDAKERDIKEAIEKIDPDYQNREINDSLTPAKVEAEESAGNSNNKLFASITSYRKRELCEHKKDSLTESSLASGSDENDSRYDDSLSIQSSLQHETVKEEQLTEKEPSFSDESSVKSDVSKLDLKINDVPSLNIENKLDHLTFQSDIEKCKDILIQNHINKELHDFEVQHGHLNAIHSMKPSKEVSDLGLELLKSYDKNGKERINQNMLLEAFHSTKFEKENIEFDKTLEKEKYISSAIFPCEKKSDSDKTDERVKHDRDKNRHKDRSDKHEHDRDKHKSNKTDRSSEKTEKEKRRDDCVAKNDRIKTEKDSEKTHHKDRTDRDIEKVKQDEISSRHDHHRRDKTDKDKRTENDDKDSSKVQKEDKHKHDKIKKEGEPKRESKKDDSIKIRKSSREEISRDLYRKDSTDSTTSRASHDSIRLKDLDHLEIKEEKPKTKHLSDLIIKQELDKELSPKSENVKLEGVLKIKSEVKEEKDSEQHSKSKPNCNLEIPVKSKTDITEKPRHYSVDSPSLDCKRKERLNSSSSLPSNIGYKRRMSSQDSIDSFHEELKKCRNETKVPDRRDSKDSRSTDRHKTTKFNKGHFAKIIESKTKDDKKNQVKPPDDAFHIISKEVESKDVKNIVKKSVLGDSEERANLSSEYQPETLQNDLDFLATLELRSSEEDERQKALRKEMKEKKRIQQLQQIQELQMQQDALQQAEFMGKLKDEKKQKTDEKKKEVAREKRMSTDRKSRDDKSDSNCKRKNRRQMQNTDSSDSDEPKKHSIFDIVDDEPMYISMYDKVKARSCKNMQKQEAEKRQEKIKAKFSQLKQSRAKREEKKRSSWDEDSDSDQDRIKSQKLSMDSSSEDGRRDVLHSKKREKSHSLDYDRLKASDYYNITSNEEDSRNKLSRKNSRSRIISDTSDDDISKRSISKSPSFNIEIRKELMSDFETLHKAKRDNIPPKDLTDKIKKSSLFNLFGKSDSDDNKFKMSMENNDIKSNFTKTFTNDFSSESECAMSNRIAEEIRRRHKKKLKKHKFSYSDDETKTESTDAMRDTEPKLKLSEKFRRHSTKKEKRKEKIRDSIDADDNRDEKVKVKKDKKPINNSFDLEPICSNKKEGKMEDIFGPLSDESDRNLETTKKNDFPAHGYDSAFNISSDQLRALSNNEEIKSKDKEDNRRKREKKRRDKRPFIKEDDNSLDVDAVSKAIEARLFADALNNDDGRQKLESFTAKISKPQSNLFGYTDAEFMTDKSKVNDKHHDKLRRDSKEKKKKRKKNKEDRQNRKEHHHSGHGEKLDKSDYVTCGNPIGELSPKTILLDIPLPNDAQTVNLSEKLDDAKSLSESPSLPMLTDSPPQSMGEKPANNRKNSDASDRRVSEQDMEIEYIPKKTIEIIDIPMPPPYNNIVQDISEVPLPEDPIPVKSEQSNAENFLPNFVRDADVSEDAVRSIPPILEREVEKPLDKVESQCSKVEKKIDEKPRAIISQEETADAVAALLGESFGGKENAFSNCYEEDETDTVNQIETESSIRENNNIPEEDAEEMRRAVQNLNASEMEMKPDTPMSDSDLLLIDTDTEETEETPQDAVARLPFNKEQITKNQTLSEQTKPSAETTVAVTKQATLSTVNTETTVSNVKANESEIKTPPVIRENIKQITSTATPVITSWTLTNNKLMEPQVLNVQPKQMLNREINDNKPTHITANIVQIKASQNQALSTSLRPIISPNRASAPYQVINHMIRPQAPNIQPPTIKIPEPHIMYQKPPSILISPRTATDPRQQSPKLSPQGESMTSPRLTNMTTILSTSPQSLNSVGIASPNTIQQRSPGQVTVVRMQQPPLSPMQTMHIPAGAKTMVSPSRPNSVLVQTQGGPIHFNRLPITPVLAPISKQISANNVAQQNKGIGANTSSLLHHQKMLSGEPRKPDHRKVTENLSENSKIILSPTSLQHSSTNLTVMAQNRLISMQNAIQPGNINSPIHLSSKVVINNMSNLGEKRENHIPKSDQHNHSPFGAVQVHVAKVNHSNSSIMQSSSKPVMCTLQEACTINRGPNSNVIHTLNSQRLLTTAPVSNLLQLDANKNPPSVLAMAAIRPPTVLTKVESSKSVVATTSSLENVVMTPLILKTNNTTSPIKLTNKSDVEQSESYSMLKIPTGAPPANEGKYDVKTESQKTFTSICDKSDKHKNICDIVVKCDRQTDFEELLKDNTNEIKKVNNDPEKMLEVNVGKTVTLISAAGEKKQSIEVCKDEPREIQEDIIPEPVSVDNKELISNMQKEKEIKEDYNNHHINQSEAVKVEESNLSVKKPLLDDIFNKVSIEEQNYTEFKSIKNTNENNIFNITSRPLECGDSQIKSLDESDSWSAKDINIESVIKKVDSLCNDNFDMDVKDDTNSPVKHKTDSELVPDGTENLDTLDSVKPMEVKSESESIIVNPSEEVSAEKTTPVSKRGGRNVRGKKSEKNQDRVQTRQISKPARGATAVKRGRGRAKVDKRIKNMVNIANNLPGDVYDFHEDSGDETSTSPNKTEVRPRLILTIKSPLSGQSNAIATSTLSITPKEQLKSAEKSNKDEKSEDFLSPSANTRKSRRLQEKDVQRSTVDDVIEDVVKGTTQPKGAKETNKKRQTRQSGAKVNHIDKAAGSDTRKSPRGVKRTRDRSLSDTSVDSSDEKVIKRDEVLKDCKVPKIAEPSAASKMELDTPQLAITAGPTSINTTTPPKSNVTPIPTKPNVTPIPTKPDISPTTTIQPNTAPLPAIKPNAGPLPTIKPVATPMPTIKTNATPIQSFKPNATQIPIVKPISTSTPSSVLNPLSIPPSNPVSALIPPNNPIPTPIMKPPKKMISEISAKLASAFEAAAARAPLPAAPLEAAPRAPPAPPADLLAAATGEARGMGSEGGGGGPAGAAEAGDARVLSPALPHREPPRRADRATPVLIRGGEGEGASGAGAGALGAGAGARLPRCPGTASLPRGAHHPALPAHAALPAQPAHPALPALHSHHHHPHHPGAASRVTITSVPSISPQGQIPTGEGMYPHFSHQHYQMYQQHFRATQHESRATPSPYTRSLEAEGCEAPTPPLELRRPPSARVPRPAHSPAPAPTPSPHDRLIMYAAGCGRSPPPAHGTSRLPSALPPSLPGPPHASQVPREADSLQMLLRRYPVMWQGLLALKNDSAAVQMHFVGGNPGVAGDTLPRHTDGSTPPLRIAQRMRLEPAQLDQVHRKMMLENEHCILLALPCGRDHMDVLQQSTNLTAGFITYLQRKQAAGIVNVAPPGHHQLVIPQAMYTVHIFPSCDFANENLSRIAPDLMHRVADIAHLLIVIATV